MYFFVFCSIVFCYLSFLNFDPFKSSFFLVISLIFFCFAISFFSHVWYSYFVCLLFLSGVFVMIVYMSSLSGFSIFENTFFHFIFFIVSLASPIPFLLFFYNSFSMNFIYYFVYFPSLFFIIFILVFFMNFVSFYLNYSSGLRIG